MKRLTKLFTCMLLLAASCRLQGSKSARQQAIPGIWYGENLQANEKDRPSPVSDVQKKEFLELLKTLPTDGEFYTKEAIRNTGPYLPVLFALTEKDIENYDFYPFGAVSRGLCDHAEHRRYAVRHFAEIQHPMLKLLWAAMLFDQNAISPEIVRFLQKALRSDQQAGVLSEMIGPDFEDFKKRVLNHPSAPDLQ